MPARSPARSSKRSTTAAPAAPSAGPPADAVRWLLLIHQIPPKPDYLRVKIGRRLQRVGAIAIKNSVYVLPPRPESYEDFRWIVCEIEDGGGEAFLAEASLGAGLSDDGVRERFNAARNQAYGEILVDAAALLKSAKQVGTVKARGRSGPVRTAIERDLAKLRQRNEAVRAIDFFAAPEGGSVTLSFADIEHRLHEARAGASRHGRGVRVEGSTWVTRQGIHIDRIASAWLIRRFIDRRPQFRFVDETKYAHRPDELRFDMFEAEYTHVGDACTFETLIQTFIVSDPALRDIAEIVHDVDCKDQKFDRVEAPGVARMIAGVVALCARDEDRVDRGARLFDDLYAAFRGRVS